MRTSARLLALVGFAALGAVLVAHHEWFRDEAFTWLVLRARRPLAEIFADIGFNGHPRFYYLLNFALVSVWRSPFAMALLNLALALAAVALFVASAPLGDADKVLFCLGFFPLYQYGATVRPYSLILFLFFLYCHLRRTRPQAWAARTAALVALAQVHVLALALAGGLLALEAWDVWTKAPAAPRRAAFGAGAALVAASILFAAWQVVPPMPTGRLHSSGGPLALIGPGHAFFPNFGIFVDHHAPEVAGLLLFALSWRAFRGRRAAVVWYAMTSATLMAVSLVVYSGYRWHHGFYFLYFLAAPWLAGTSPAGDLFARRYLTGMLALQAAFGLYAVGLEVARPYSNGPSVARFIVDHGLADAPLAGLEYHPDDSPDAPWRWDLDQLQAVAMHLPGKQMEDPVAGAEAVTWRQYFNPEAYFPPQSARAMEASLRALARKLGRPYLVAVAWPRGPEEGTAPPPLEKLAEFPVPFDYGEHLRLYRCPAP